MNVPKSPAGSGLPPGNHSEKCLFWFFFVWLTFLGLCLRLYKVGSYDYWTDELNAIRASRDWESIHAYCFQWLTSPPTRYLITHFFLNTFYEPQHYFRIPSVVAGTLCIPVGMIVGRRWWGTETAVWFGLLLAVNPWITAHSQDVRMHVLPLFFLLAAVALTVPRWRRFSPGAVVLGGACLALASSITYPAVLTSAGCCWLILDSFYRERNTKHPFLRYGVLLCVPWFLWLVLWFGWLMVEAPNSPLHRQPAEAATVAPPSPPPSPKTVSLYALPPQLWTPGFFRDALRSHLGDGLLRWLTLLGAILFVLPGSSGGGVPGRPGRVGLFLVPYLLAVSQKPSQFYPRYGLSLLPFALLGLAWGIENAVQGVDRLGARIFSPEAGDPRSGLWARGTVRVLVFGLLFGLTLPPTLKVLSLPPQAWREALDYVIENWEPNDKLLVGTHQAEYGVFVYNAGRIPDRAIVYRVFSGTRIKEETVNTPHRRWLIQWYGFPPYVERILNRFYEKARVFPSRYGPVTVYKKRSEPLPDSVPPGE